jgi:antitoxin MazE
MQTTVQKWGNSLAVRIPGSYVKETKIDIGSKIDISCDKGTIIIKPQKKYRLKGLIDKVTDKNTHSETHTGKVVGNELW